VWSTAVFPVESISPHRWKPLAKPGIGCATAFEAPISGNPLYGHARRNLGAGDPDSGPAQAQKIHAQSAGRQNRSLRRLSLASRTWPVTSNRGGPDRHQRNPGRTDHLFLQFAQTHGIALGDPSGRVMHAVLRRRDYRHPCLAEDESVLLDA